MPRRFDLVCDDGGAGRSSAATVDRLDLGVEFERPATGFAERRCAGTLEAAERRIDQISRCRAVDLDGPRLNVVGEVVDVAGGAGRDRRRQTAFPILWP